MTTNQFSYNFAGTVRNQGLPVVGVVVALIDLDDGRAQIFEDRDSEKIVAAQRTTARGDFSFAVAPGYYRIHVQPENGTRFLNYVSEPTVVRANTTNNINLLTGTVVSGRVVTPDGRAVERGYVAALVDDQAPYQVLSKIVSGRYSIVLPRGNYYLAYVASPQSGVAKILDASVDLEESLIGNQEIPVVSNVYHYLEVTNDNAFDIIIPSLVEFSGAVFDLTGQPVSGATALLSPTEDPEQPFYEQLRLVTEAKTDESGQFQVLVQPGNYDLIIQPEESSSLLGSKREQLAIQERQGRRFTLSDGFRLRGQVNHRESPVRNCLIRVISGESGQEFQGLTDGSGSFALTLPAGVYKVVAKADREHDTRYGAPLSADIVSPYTRTVIVGGDTHVAIKLRDGVPITGKVVDDFGQPRRGIRVTAFEDTDVAISHQSLRRGLASDVTDENGDYELFLAEGSYRLVCHRDFAHAFHIKVEKEPCRADITWPGWAHMQFEVTDERGEGISRCLLRYFAYGKERGASSPLDVDREVFPRDSLVTDHDGVCRVTLPFGVYSLVFVPPKNTNFQERVIRQLSVNGDVTRKVSLPRSGTHP